MIASDISYTSGDGVRWAWRQSIRHDLKLAYRILLLAIATHADEDGCSQITRKQLAALTGITDRSVSRCVRHFKNVGILTVRRPNGRSSVYVLRDWSALNPEVMGHLPGAADSSAPAALGQMQFNF